jgi:hypothetical protein
MGLIATVAIIVLSSGPDPAARGNPTSTWKAEPPTASPDSRVGIEPLPSRNRTSKRQHGRGLRLRLPEEGDEHIPASAPEPRFKTNPPTSVEHVEEQQADGA